MLSIIIPTKNEEYYLPKLLESIKRQDYKNYEIIVADAGSKDKTRDVARKSGCKVVKGGLPSIGRNNGAKYAKGELLLFLDADTVLPENFLKDLKTIAYETVLNIKSKSDEVWVKRYERICGWLDEHYKEEPK